MYYVYALAHPDNYNVAYVGITNNLPVRYKTHLLCNGNNVLLNTWIDYLLSCGQFPVMDVLIQKQTRQEILTAEKEIIKEFSPFGILLNIDQYQSSIPKSTINKKYIRYKAMLYHCF